MGAEDTPTPTSDSGGEEFDESMPPLVRVDPD